MASETDRSGTIPGWSARGRKRTLPLEDKSKIEDPSTSGPYAWVAILGGLVSFFLPAYELRPNRIASGLAAWLWQVPALSASVVTILVLMATSLIMHRLSQTQLGKTRLSGGTDVQESTKLRQVLRVVLPQVTPPLLVLIQVLLILTPGLFFTGQDKLANAPSYRVSPAAGFWAIQGMVIFALAWAFSFHSWWIKKPVAGFLLALVGITLMLAGWKAGLLGVFSPWKELLAQGPRFAAELGRHLYLSGVSFGSALVVGIGAAVVSSRNRGIETVVATLAGSVQNIPSLALFGLLLPVLATLSSAFPALRSLGISGIGAAPAILALTAYGILPVILATLAGLRMVDPGAKDAARGMGMGPNQILFKVELPLALPSIAGGARTALVQTIGTATVAALVGAGGMGYFIFQGIGQASMDMVVLGVIPVVLLSLLADRGMAALIGMLTGKEGRLWH